MIFELVLTSPPVKSIYIFEDKIKDKDSCYFYDEVMEN